jgi:hypothetical protein
MKTRSARIGRLLEQGIIFTGAQNVVYTLRRIVDAQKWSAVRVSISGAGFVDRILKVVFIG